MCAGAPSNRECERQAKSFGVIQTLIDRSKIADHIHRAHADRLVELQLEGCSGERAQLAVMSDTADKRDGQYRSTSLSETWTMARLGVYGASSDDRACLRVAAGRDGP